MAAHVPSSPRLLAATLAPRCRALRDAVLAALATPSSGLQTIAAEWRALAMMDDAQFADAFAQTVTEALWIDHLDLAADDPEILFRKGRGSGAGVVVTGGLLGRALTEATRHRAEIAGPLAALEAAIASVDRQTLAKDEHGQLCFHEALLAAYDGQLRRAAGTYYTPAEVVQAQVAIVGALLEQELGQPLKFAGPGVRTIDPACGTGVYPCAIVDYTARCGGAPHDAAATMWGTRLLDNLEARELHLAPCAVAQLRIARSLERVGAGSSMRAVRVRCGDTLARPSERDDWWTGRSVGVCIGNPPYDRQELARGDLRGGGWVRFGDPARGEPPILSDFVPSGAAGQHAKNIYNQYVYFWRWALWRVFERSHQAGIVCFITPSSYLRGPGFSALRRHTREVLDALWILDLGGDPLGPRSSANVFSIRTPVCIAVGLRRAGGDRSRPAEVWYAQIGEGGDRAAKLDALSKVRSLADLAWARGPQGWEAPFIPAGRGECGDWPRLVDLLPWQHSGAQWKRTWPVAETQELLGRRWRDLLRADDRRLALRETEAWTVAREGVDLVDGVTRLPALASLPADAPAPQICRTSWRPLDRRWCLADGRLGDRLRPVLWQCHGPSQIYLTTLLSTRLSSGPAVFACGEVPDLHHFRGSYGDKGMIPMWRDAAATAPNVCPGLLEFLNARLGVEVTPQALFGYVYGCLAAPGLALGLAEAGPRVPLTADPALFTRCAAVGAELLTAHTFYKFKFGSGLDRGRSPGAARSVVAVPGEPYPHEFAYAGGELRVGGGVFAPVSAAVWAYEVSGYKIVRSWLAARMQKPGGRASSPLDLLRPAAWTETLTHELLELLWALERSLELHAEQGAILSEIVAGPWIGEAELPRPTAASRQAPRAGGRGA